MSQTNYSFEQDLKEASAMADALVPYVHENELYGKVGGGGFFSMSRMPALTIGALLLRLRRLRVLADQLTPAQQTTLAAAEMQHETVRREWAQHYSRKLDQEAKSRLRAIDQYFDECREDPRSAVNGYLPEVLRRTIVQEIMLAQPSDELTAALRKTDTGLRRWTQPSEDFIWAEPLRPAYPQSPYWWLYARPVPVKASKEE